MYAAQCMKYRVKKDEHDKDVKFYCIKDAGHAGPHRDYLGNTFRDKKLDK
jgi:hypothetical protein